MSTKSTSPPRGGDTGRSGPAGKATADRALLEERRRLEQSCLETSRRCLGLLSASEQLGAASAAGLGRQGGVLRRAERCVDSIDVALRPAGVPETRRGGHAGMSWWGGLRSVVVGGGLGRSRRAQGETRPATAATLLDRHLDDMLGSVAFLRALAEDLGRELDDQEQQVARLGLGAERVAATVERRTRELARLL
ncbi:uncharacterized protein LOC134534297 isoform X2 [Bacillus rossius redtenbacheri]|uniref:uncharacterized protein LOC134534297 isoform X2 n=1 Tax=Bacillus rossius redtenbacheri TaxID=93214 RepID=UPI002FDD2222